MKEHARTAHPAFEGLIAFAAGALFAVGLALAGMTQPAKIVGFLDVGGDWDPSLAFVMMGAIAVFFTANRLLPRIARPLVGATFRLPTRRDIEPDLVIGSALFGVGWGLAGYCPGPALTALATGSTSALAFVAAMTTGMLGLVQLRKRRAPRPRCEPQPTPAAPPST